MQTHGFKDTGFLTGMFLLQCESNGGPLLHPEENARPRRGRMMEDTDDKPRDRTLTAPRDSGAFWSFALISMGFVGRKEITSQYVIQLSIGRICADRSRAESTSISFWGKKEEKEGERRGGRGGQRD